MRNIVIGPEAFTNQSYGGITRSECEIYNRLTRRADLDVRLGMLYTHNMYLLNAGFSVWRDTYEGISEETMGAAMYTCKLLETADVYHPTWTDQQFNIIGRLDKIKVVITVHDCIDELSGTVYAGIKGAWVKRADHIVVPSEHTKTQVLSLYPYKTSDDITVIPHGAPIIEQTETLHVPPYILFVGGRSGYKNWEAFIQHSLEFLTRHPELHVRCTGYQFNDAERTFLEKLGLTERVICTPVRSDVAMWSLYAGASMFVFPSGTEGFGMPILEAMACGCPVILNEDCEVFHEVAGNAAAYFSFPKNNLSEIEEDIYAHGVDQSVLARHAARFSWDAAAEKYAEIYKNI